MQQPSRGLEMGTFECLVVSKGTASYLRQPMDPNDLINLINLVVRWG